MWSLGRMQEMLPSASRNRFFRGMVAALLAAMTLFAIPEKSSASPVREIYVMRLAGAIGPASASFVAEGLEQAKQADAELVVIIMDTPGGLDTSMREIIKQILAMPFPVAAYVHPSGARAASAGTYILYASHLAAMTPGTNLGAATPIQIGAAPPSSDEGGEGDAAQAPAAIAERKSVNDAVAYIRSLAELRGRNADWAEEAVRSAASLSADAALERGVIDIVAPDLASLLEQLNGREVTIDGAIREISTAGAAIEEIEPGWVTQFLATITDPNIALILMMIGIYGLIFEFLNPGALVPGTVGAICLLVGFYALAVLPVDFVGLALIVLGIGLMVAEAFAPSFGILGIGGILAFLFGATVLFDTDLPEFRVSWSVIAALGVFSAGVIILVVRTGLSSFSQRVVSGAEELIGASAIVTDWKDGKGHVFVHSERWNAQGPDDLRTGEQVIVNRLAGLSLTVSAAGKKTG